MTAPGWRRRLLAEEDRTPFFLLIGVTVAHVYILSPGFILTKTDAEGSSSCTFASSMDFVRDIFVNLLSSAIWAIGGYMIARFFFEKKDAVVNNILFKKRFPVAFIATGLFKKS